MNAQLWQIILAKTATKNVLQRRMMFIRQLLQQMLFVQPKINPKLAIERFIAKTSLNQPDVDFFRSLGSDFLSFSKQNAYLLIDQLEDIVEKIPTLTITAPIEIAENEAEKIANFAKRMLSKDLIVDFKVNPAVLGGCGLSWKGVYYDFSLPYYIKNNREKLLKLIYNHAKEKHYPN